MSGIRVSVKANTVIVGDVLCIGGFRYDVTAVEHLGSGSTLITIDTGFNTVYTEVLTSGQNVWVVERPVTAAPKLVTGNVIRWDATDADGITYGVTTDNMVTLDVSIIAGHWMICLADANGQTIAKDHTMRDSMPLSAVKDWAVRLVNRELLARR